MDRPERYDPEDIENLLRERGFDELLDTERAYVLRHLSGREEYEAMRELLRQVHSDGGKRTPLAADDHIRTNVLEAFRKGQEPSWRIWLNTIRNTLFPPLPEGLWRPALALATVALLIGAGVWVFRQGDLGPAAVAEVEQKPPLSTPLPLPQQVPDRQLDSSETVALPKGDRSSDRSYAEVEDMRRPTALTDAVADDTQILPVPTRLDEVLEDEMLVSEAQVDAEMDKTTQGETKERDVRYSHTVTASELAQNQSLSNATGKVVTIATKKEKEGIGSIALSTDPALLALVGQAW